MNIRLLLLALFFVLAILFAGLPRAHQWYEPNCCSGNDCEPVPPGALVEEVRGGWRVAYVSPKLGPVEIFFPRALKRDSRDGGFHACVRPDTRTPICIYVPVNT